MYYVTLSYAITVDQTCTSVAGWLCLNHMLLRCILIVDMKEVPII